MDHQWKFPSSLCVKPDHLASLVRLRLYLIIRAGPVVDYSHHRSTNNHLVRCFFRHHNRVHLRIRRNVAILSDMRHPCNMRLPCILSLIAHMVCAPRDLALGVPAMIEPTGRHQGHPSPGPTVQNMSLLDLHDLGHDRSHHLAINQIRRLLDPGQPPMHLPLLRRERHGLGTQQVAEPWPRELKRSYVNARSFASRHPYLITRHGRMRS